jgi:hypothetical protein
MAVHSGWSQGRSEGFGRGQPGRSGGQDGDASTEQRTFTSATGYTSWNAQNHTAQNVADHLQREAFYGVGAVMTMGDQPDRAIEFQQSQKAEKCPTRRIFSRPAWHRQGRAGLTAHPGHDAPACRV